MKKVVVMMSTYNGEKYIKDQIESILNQKGVDIELVMRDDGSTDKTLDIINDYLSDSRCSLLKGHNIGAAMSFMELLFCAPKADFYSFSDQDDIWKTDKLLIATNKIGSYDCPMLYHGLAGRVDENLNPLPNINYKPKNEFSAALLTSATGCTMVFNQQLMDLLRLYKPSYVSMHDAWVYRVCYALGGKVVYDNNSHILYRQHGNNVSGGNMNFRKKIKKQFGDNACLRLNTAKELYNGYNKLIDRKNSEILLDFINYQDNLSSKIRVIFGNKYTLNSIKTTLQYKFLFLINKI